MKPVYFVGAHGSGKTSLSRWVSKTYNIVMLGEVARTELARRESSLDRMRLDVDEISDYQRAVFMAQIEIEERTTLPYVSDRSFDNVAYLAAHGLGLADLLASVDMDRYLARVRSGVVFFVRPHGSTVRADEARPQEDTDTAGQHQIDGAVRTLLELWRIPYVPIPAASPKDRQLIIGSILDRDGFKR